jgi:hypothetical protein
VNLYAGVSTQIPAGAVIDLKCQFAVADTDLLVKRRKSVGCISIEESVGFIGRNNPIDVAVIQGMLKKYFTEFIQVKGRSTSVIAPALKVDGECSQKTIDLIKQFQTESLGMKKPDGRVDVMGRTFSELTAQTHSVSTSIHELLFGPAPARTGLLTRVNPAHFRKLYAKQKGLRLTITKGEDLLGFFAMLQNDPEIDDIRWAAYILATVHKETEFSFKPKEENGKGAGREYAKTKQVTDTLACRGPKGAVYSNAYYGRGFVQITHEENYQVIGKAYGIGDELFINPDKALEPEISYFITSHGMRHGTFTGGVHKLRDHINDKKCDYKEARRIVNGKDRWEEIAEYARKIEILLRLCVH